MARIFCRPNKPNGAENKASATPGPSASSMWGSGVRGGVKLRPQRAVLRCKRLQPLNQDLVLTPRVRERNGELSRGHLSRSACRHVKQRAKRSGRIQNRRLVSSPSGAVGAEDLNDDEPEKIPRSQDTETRDAIDPWRL